MTGDTLNVTCDTDTWWGGELYLKLPAHYMEENNKITKDLLLFCKVIKINKVDEGK